MYKMVKRMSKGSDGKYHKGGLTFEKLEGSRAEVMHGKAYKTKGGLVKKDLTYNKGGEIVSKKKSVAAKKEKRLEKHGWTAKKGKFGAVRLSSKKTAKKSAKKSKKSRRRRR
jgi:hypothetical protein